MLLNKESELAKKEDILNKMLKTIQSKSDEFDKFVKVKTAEFKNREELISISQKKSNQHFESKHKQLTDLYTQNELKSKSIQDQINKLYTEKMKNLTLMKNDISILWEKINNIKQPNSDYIDLFYEKYQSKTSEPIDMSKRIEDITNHEQKLKSLYSKINYNNLTIPDDLINMDALKNTYQEITITKYNNGN